MSSKLYEIESEKPFSESMIWQLNREFYNREGIEAWSSGDVPHHLTSNSMVGKTYAELIFGFLKDLARKGKTEERVYILELGAGHGRLAFHILKHLERLEANAKLKLPPFCYILSDIVEQNLTFFEEHAQFQSYYEKGNLDVAFFDAVDSKELVLRKAGKTIQPKDLNQPLLALANYFFDSIPTDVFLFQNTNVSACSVSIQSKVDPAVQKPILSDLELSMHSTPLVNPHYKDKGFNKILESYRQTVFNTYLFFPKIGLECIENLRELSNSGFLLLSMDKGFHEIHDLENVKEPDMVSHGSVSFWVNFHAMGAYCEQKGGTALFPSYSNYHLELACLMFLPEAETYTETRSSYQRFVDDFGPDDFTGMKKFTYKHIANMELRELIGVLRLSAYDSAMFINVLPRLKQVYGRITFNDRTRLAQTMDQTWNMYFYLNEPEDLAFEMGGMLYALGYYQKALDYFEHSVLNYGETQDEFYNRALCFYQLRKDNQFLATVKAAKLAFPGYEKFDHLDKLDLGAE